MKYELNLEAIKKKKSDIPKIIVDKKFPNEPKDILL